MKLTEFDYHLPKGLIAQYPLERRDASRLLVLDRKRSSIDHKHFSDIYEYLSCGDCLVLNNTKVIPARMIGKRQKSNEKTGGGKQELFLVEQLSNNEYRVLAKPAKKLNLGMKVIFSDGACTAEVIADEGMKKIVRFSANDAGGDFWQMLGQIPLPPYIKRAPECEDKERYQTVYAKELGASAAPTAGLHFTKNTLCMLQEKGIKVAYLTLHVNYGTFAPVKVNNIQEHIMHKECYILPDASARIINEVKSRGNKVFAVGTTSVRVLETVAAGNDLPLKESQGWSDLFIYPPYKFKVVDALLTNFHFPKSTLLMLVSAFGTKEFVFRAYNEAIKKEYRFFSYGDVMLIK